MKKIYLISLIFIVTAILVTGGLYLFLTLRGETEVPDVHGLESEYTHPVVGYTIRYPRELEVRENVFGPLARYSDDLLKERKGEAETPHIEFTSNTLHLLFEVQVAPADWERSQATWDSARRTFTKTDLHFAKEAYRLELDIRSAFEDSLILEEYDESMETEASVGIVFLANEKIYLISYAGDKDGLAVAERMMNTFRPGTASAEALEAHYSTVPSGPAP